MRRLSMIPRPFLTTPRSILRLLPLLALMGCAQGAAGAGEAPGPDGAEAWAEATLRRLTLREKVAQLVVPWIDGSYLAVGTDAYERLRGWVQDDGVGGVIISIGPPLEVASKLNLLQELAPLPLLVAADVERGPAQRLTAGTALPSGIELGGGTDFPPIMALGATGDERLAYEVGRITALEVRATGIHMAYAPVVDVNYNPSNPIVNTRSYGEDPELVARLGAAHIRGLQDHGVLATAKHFPGHGDTEVDSHIGLPILEFDRERLEAVELPPFRAAIEAGVAAVMVAHIAFPSLTGDSTPASLSRAITTGLLREELGFDGLVLVDALNMGAITEGYGPGEAAVRALEAGADVLLMPPDVGRAIDAVVAAVGEGRLTEERIDRSVRKLLRTKASLGLHRRRFVDLDAIPRIVGSPAHLAVAREVAERSITLARDRDGLLPLDPAKTPRVLSIIYTDATEPFAGRILQAAVRARFPGARTVHLTEGASPAAYDSLLAAAADVDLVLVSSFVRIASGKGRVGLPRDAAAFVNGLALRRPTVVASFGDPYLLRQLPAVGTYLLAWGPGAAEQVAAMRALLGEAPITGRLPITIEAGALGSVGSGGEVDPALRLVRPEEVGMDPAGLERVDQILEAAVRDGAVPGAALAVGRRGRLVRLRGYGRLDPRPGSAPATESTIYDVASLTKVVGTTTAVMILDEEGRIDLDAPVSRYLPEWRGGGKDGVTVRHLLTHTSGLPAFSPLWRELEGKDAYIRHILALPLEYQPGTKTVYSDFGAILLGEIVERVAGEPLDRFLERRVFGPLGMRDTGFDPLGLARLATGSGPPDPAVVAAPTVRDSPAQAGGAGAAAPGRPGGPGADLLERIAPTEVDTYFRHMHVHGVVHDENAYAMGGVAGHAGLFSSARDLARFAMFLLDGGIYEGERLLRPETIRTYTTRQALGSSRALGWDTPSPGSSAGDHFSERSFGHTGFTGTSIWIDPERELFVVLLTNRVNPTRENQKHIRLRREVHDAVQLSIIDMPPGNRKAGTW